MPKVQTPSLLPYLVPLRINLLPVVKKALEELDTQAGVEPNGTTTATIVSNLEGLNLELIGNKFNQSWGLGVDERTDGSQNFGSTTLRTLKTNDRNSLSLLVVLSHHANSKMGCKGGDSGDRPVQLDELGSSLSRLLIPDNNSTTNAEIAIPPCGIEGSSVGRNAQLNKPSLDGLCADRLEFGGESVNVTANHSDTIAGFVRLANLESDEGAAVSCNPILSTWLDLTRPAIARRELIIRLELLLKVIDGVENGRVLLEEVAERLGESLGLKLLNLAQATSLTSLQVPIDLTNLPRRKLGDTRCAGAVVSCVAALHIRQDEALGAFLVLDRCRRRRIVIVEHS
ncbi:hypothetical protein HG531_006344 [Fusarium graminearum]|nr:hypothetical protein HG531_006344 [Fusarium graminearum]